VRGVATRYDNQAAVTKALRLWLNKNPYKTYHSLIEILVKLGRVENDTAGTLTIDVSIIIIFHWLCII